MVADGPFHIQESLSISRESLKGALQVFEEDELILREAPLVGVQHYDNKRQVLVCSHCFRFVGSIEAQIAWRLAAQPMGETDEHHCCSTLRLLLWTGLCLPSCSFLITRLILCLVEVLAQVFTCVYIA